MRISSSLIALGIAASVSARVGVRQNVPDCLLTCIATANTSGCDSSDTACLCGNDTFVSSVTQCVQSSCSADDVQASLEGAQAVCAGAGVTLSNIPTDTASGSGSNSATETSSSGESQTTASGSHTSSASGSSSTSASQTSSADGSEETGDENAASAHGVSALVGLAAAGLAAFVF
ncbi:hypothetical protein HDZ31DRAFT_75371 [Schizophyllum fasciatum]